MSSKALFSHDGETFEFPEVAATEGNRGYDTTGFFPQTGKVFLDNGFANTASCCSAITFINGGEGVLRHRGYPIDQLAENASFLEVAYLLLYEELPTLAELEQFRDDVMRRMMLDEGQREMFRSFPRGAHPMQVLQANVSALAAFNPGTLDPHDPEQLNEASLRLLGAMPTLAAYAYKASVGEPYLYPKRHRGYVENYLRMSFASPLEEYHVDPDVVKAFETLFILHADHGQNCSTSAVRLVGSSDATLYASVAAGIGALSGPLHGGANQAVLEMLSMIRQEGLSARDFLKQVKDKESTIRLMGFGHRIYKNYDPRAKIIKTHAYKLLEHASKSNDLLQIALELEETALNDDYFIERRLYPNVDFYTGLIYKAMGFSPTFFTALFALGRLPGWIAQYREQQQDPDRKISRPRQIYTGEPLREFVPIEQR
ncbi:MAG: citrate (Si)-synthase [Arachnia propionica]|nr:MAG: citrate (Si)-synthase [Arachnia propionica]